MSRAWLELLLAADAADDRVAFAATAIHLAERRGWQAFPVIRSNQSVLLTVEMRQTLATALFEEARRCEEAESPPPSTLEALEAQLLEPFLVRCYALWQRLPEHRRGSVVTSMSFEAVCPHRRTLWGSLQLGLAVAYCSGSLKYLGHSYGDGTSFPAYCPHGEVHALVDEVGLRQPCWLRIESAGQVNEAMDQLSKVLRGQLSEADFLARDGWRQSTAPAASVASSIDAEGFVLLTNDGEYSKVKVREYYLCHKLRASNLPLVLSMPAAVGAYYPLVTALHRAMCRGPAGAAPRLRREVAGTLASLCGQLQRELRERHGELVDAARERFLARGATERARARMETEWKRKLDQCPPGVRAKDLVLPTSASWMGAVQRAAVEHRMRIVGDEAYGSFAALLTVAFLRRPLGVSADEVCGTQHAVHTWCTAKLEELISESGFERAERASKLRYRKSSLAEEEKELAAWHASNADLRRSFEALLYHTESV